MAAAVRRRCDAIQESFRSASTVLVSLNHEKLSTRAPTSINSDLDLQAQSWTSQVVGWRATRPMTSSGTGASRARRGCWRRSRVGDLPRPAGGGPALRACGRDHAVVAQSVSQALGSKTSADVGPGPRCVGSVGPRVVLQEVAHH